MVQNFKNQDIVAEIELFFIKNGRDPRQWYSKTLGNTTIINIFLLTIKIFLRKIIYILYIILMKKKKKNKKYNILFCLFSSKYQKI